MGIYHAESDLSPETAARSITEAQLSPGYLLPAGSPLYLCLLFAFRLFWRLIMSSLFLGVITPVPERRGGGGEGLGICLSVLEII